MKPNRLPKFLNRVRRITINAAIARLVSASRGGNQIAGIIKLSHHAVEGKGGWGTGGCGDRGTLGRGDEGRGRRGDTGTRRRGALKLLASILCVCPELVSVVFSHRLNSY